MKTKKITALVLAALMAAGTTATAFADSDVVNRGGDLDDKRPLTFNDETIYENEDGVLTPSTDFRPGDTLYIRLDELNSNGDKKIEDEKDDMNVYADWKVGKDAVESVDIVYKKGNYFNNLDETTFTFTVDGEKLEINGANLTTDVAVKNAILAEIQDHLATHPDFLKDEIAAQLAKYVVEDGFKDAAGNYYADGYAVSAFQDSTDNKYYAADEVAEYVPTEFANDGADVLGSGLYLDPADTGIIVNAADYENHGTNWTKPADASEYLVTALNGDFKAIKVADVADVTVADLVNEGFVTVAAGTIFDKDTRAAAAGITEIDDTVYVVNNKIVAKTVADAEAEDDAIAAAAANAATEYVVSYKNNYTYWVEIKTKEDDTTKVLDLAGVLRIGSTKNKAEDATNAFQLDTSLDNRVYDSGAYVTVEDEWTFAPDSRSVVKFSDDAEDVVLYFGENEAAWFEFDARGQSALNLEFTFDFNKEIADLFPEANIDFLTFTSKPATNRTGDLYIVADEDTYLYEVTDNGVKTVAYLPAGGTGSAAVSAALGVKNINGAEYDEKEGAWHIRTRKLGAYAISDTELDTSRTLDGDESSSESGNSGNNNGTKPIPDTGR